MKKMVFLLALGIVALANEHLFLGAEIGGATAEGSLGSSKLNIDNEEIKAHYGIKAGAYIDNTYRVYATTQKIGKHDDKTQSYSIAYDYMFHPERSTRPYVGVNYTHLVEEYSSDSVDFKLNTNHVMANIGILHQLESMDIEAGVRIALSSNGGESINNAGTPQHVSTEKLNQFYLGANYKFNMMKKNENTEGISKNQGQEHQKRYVEVVYNEGEQILYETAADEGRIIVNNVNANNIPKINNTDSGYGVAFY